MNNLVKLIDVDKERLVQKLREYARQFVTPQLCKDLSDAANIIEVLISPPVPTIKPGDKVRHDDWGDGVVYDLDEDDSAIAIVDFDDEGLMSIHCDELEVVE